MTTEVLRLVTMFSTPRAPCPRLFWTRVPCDSTLLKPGYNRLVSRAGSARIERALMNGTRLVAVGALRLPSEGN